MIRTLLTTFLVTCFLCIPITCMDALEKQSFLKKIETLDQRQLDICLFLMAERGKTEEAVILLDRKASVAFAARGYNGMTALHVAAREGHRSMIELLLRKGAATNQVNNDGLKALDLAVAAGHDDIVQLLQPKKIA